MEGAPDIDLVAASLRADGRDLGASVEALARKLEGALPGRVASERKGGLFGGRKRLRRLTVTLGDDTFELELNGERAVCRRRKVVRGISLKSEQLDLDGWTRALSDDLLALAERSERDRLALERLLTG